MLHELSSLKYAREDLRPFGTRSQYEQVGGETQSPGSSRGRKCRCWEMDLQSGLGKRLANWRCIWPFMLHESLNRVSCAYDHVVDAITTRAMLYSRYHTDYCPLPLRWLPTRAGWVGLGRFPPSPSSKTSASSSENSSACATRIAAPNRARAKIVFMIPVVVSRQTSDCGDSVQTFIGTEAWKLFHFYKF